MGLAGMAERLKLMGGQLRLERVGGVTRLTAEAPER
jgi:signal transduction histidine kinase